MAYCTTQFFDHAVKIVKVISRTGIDFRLRGVKCKSAKICGIVPF